MSSIVFQKEIPDRSALVKEIVDLLDQAAELDAYIANVERQLVVLPAGSSQRDSLVSSLEMFKELKDDADFCIRRGRTRLAFFGV